MRDKYEQLFQNLPVLEPPRGLARDVLFRIELAQRRSARIRLICTGIIACVSFIVLIPMLRYVIQGFSQSGFYEYISIIFYDGGLLVSYWKEILLSLIDSVPYLGITGVFLSVLVLLWSFGHVIRNMKNASFHIRLFN
jgi:hypothetical protein